MIRISLLAITKQLLVLRFLDSWWLKSTDINVWIISLRKQSFKVTSLNESKHKYKWSCRNHMHIILFANNSNGSWSTWTFYWNQTLVLEKCCWYFKRVFSFRLSNKQKTLIQRNFSCKRYWKCKTSIHRQALWFFNFEQNLNSIIQWNWLQRC